MCRPIAAKLAPSASSSLHKSQLFQGGWFDGIFPLHPSIVALAMAALLPSWFYLNRGFTVWFHLACVFQVLTQSGFLVDVLALSGVSICCGWYASLGYEYFCHGRWCHVLYKNMPSILTQQMIGGGDGSLDFESGRSLAAMAICHFLDLLGHPLLTYYFWSKHQRRKNEDLKSARNEKSDKDNIFAFEWPVILSAYFFSRMWSFVHNYHNFGSMTWFYVGFDIYVIDDLDTWYPAYIAETLAFVAVVSQKFTKTPILAPTYKLRQREQYKHFK